MIDRMGDKASAKSTMIEAGVPCVPGSVNLESFEQTQEIAKSFGYPVCLKQLQVVVEKNACSLERRRFIKGMGRRSSRVSCGFGNDGMYLEN
jgi:acetyl-CoA carboxylase biotin carboxylase subunit